MVPSAKNLEIKTPRDYLASLPGERKSAVGAIHKAVRAAAPELKPRVLRGMLGYGKYHYRYPSGREGDWFVVGLASQKNYISLYICLSEKDQYLPEKNKHRLGNVSVGKSCIRFKTLADLNLRVALALIRKASMLAGKRPVKPYKTT